MKAGEGIRFGPFALDARNASLFRDGEGVALTPKAFAVLQHLAARPGQLVTKSALLDSVWDDVVVGDAVVKVTIREIRKALGDDPKEPRYVQTVHRRGYRFVATTRGTTAPAPSLVARDEELAALRFFDANDIELLNVRAIPLASGEHQFVGAVFPRAAVARVQVDFGDNDTFGVALENGADHVAVDDFRFFQSTVPQ